MSDGTPTGAAPAELVQAFRDLRPQLYDISQETSRLTPESNPEDYSREAIEQFLNAYEALVLEALEGRGRSRRDLIFDTALPVVVAEGQPVGAMVQSGVALAVTLTHLLLARVPEHVRDESAAWLAAFFSAYTRETLERVIELQREAGA
jgi:hypothetical protein